MRYLLDTHVFLWTLTDDRRIGPKARAALSAPRASIFVSAATVWEMAIKLSLGKLKMKRAELAVLSTLPERCGFSDLPVTTAHAAQVRDLAFHHHDPFDRMLIVQALSEQLVLVSADDQFGAYAARVLDASV